MKKNAVLLLIVTGVLAALVISTVTAADKAEYDVWVTSDTCWVVKEPSKTSIMVGIIMKKSNVTVNKIHDGWLKIVYAPVREPLTGKFIECAGCYIQESNTTTTPVWKWY